MEGCVEQKCQLELINSVQGDGELRVDVSSTSEEVNVRVLPPSPVMVKRSISMSLVAPGKAGISIPVTVMLPVDAS